MRGTATRRDPIRQRIHDLLRRHGGVPEMAVEAATGGGALNGEHVVEIARWYLPEAMLRLEGGAEPENIRILCACGDSMEPVVHDSDRLLADTGRRTPATGEMAVLWDGGGSASPYGQRLISTGTCSRDPLPSCWVLNFMSGVLYVAQTSTCV